MPAKCSVMFCVTGGSVTNGMVVKAISIPSSSRCCGMLSAQQFDVSSIGESCGPPSNLLQCGS